MRKTIFNTPKDLSKFQKRIKRLERDELIMSTKVSIEQMYHLRNDKTKIKRKSFSPLIKLSPIVSKLKSHLQETLSSARSKSYLHQSQIPQNENQLKPLDEALIVSEFQITPKEPNQLESCENIFDLSIHPDIKEPSLIIEIQSKLRTQINVATHCVDSNPYPFFYRV